MGISGEKMSILTESKTKQIERSAKSVTKSPKGFSFNFLGAQYGGKLFLHGGGFVCLYSISILFLPLVPIAAYMVSPSSPDTYKRIPLWSLVRISGPVPFLKLYLSSFLDGFILAIIGLGILGIILFFLI
jgi:hypothetical protein